MKFLTLKEAVHTQFTKMLNTGNVFSVSVNKHILKDTYNKLKVSLQRLKNNGL